MRIGSGFHEARWKYRSILSGIPMASASEFPATNSIFRLKELEACSRRRVGITVVKAYISSTFTNLLCLSVFRLFSRKQEPISSSHVVGTPWTGQPCSNGCVKCAEDNLNVHDISYGPIDRAASLTALCRHWPTVRGWRRARRSTRNKAR